ncbi:MAG: glutamate-5-semialdehyde dehydrogenase [bacterium]|nr:glutamate-5-semialdehyde dehydrogenase [bacterium]
MNKTFYNTVKKIKKASRDFSILNTTQKNKILLDLAVQIKKNKKVILNANKKDLHNFSEKHPLYDRLLLTGERIDGVVASIKSVVKLTDPVGQVLGQRTLKNKLKVSRVRVPFGVIGVIYESRPNVTIEVASLCIKTGNAVILRGGKEAANTNQVFVKLIQKTLINNKLPKELVYLASSKDRSAVGDMMSMDDLIDVIIPRGGKGLINFVRENSLVPVIETGAGVCHTYVESSANIDKATKIIFNAKTQRPSVCNALDTAVIDKKIITKLLPKLAKLLIEKEVKIKADHESHSILKKYYPEKLLKKATSKDFGKEFMGLTMSIKTVRNFNEGLNFIQNYTSGHSEAIISNNENYINTFLSLIDAAAVYANASTRYTDGFEFGLGAEIGISTQKLHARGPMGLEALTSYKWVIRGNGQIRM